MKTLPVFLGALLSAMLVSPSWAAETSSAPSILIYNTSGHPRVGDTNRGPQLVTALWSDGRVVWSKDGTNGGAPYYEGKFETNKLIALLATLRDEGALTNAALPRPWFGPDAATTRIVIHDGSQRLFMETWHERYERNGRAVATAQGLTPLKGRDREQILREQPVEYRQFRHTWTRVRTAVAALIPVNGDRYEGELPSMKR